MNLSTRSAITADIRYANHAPISIEATSPDTKSSISRAYPSRWPHLQVVEGVDHAHSHKGTHCSAPGNADRQPWRATAARRSALSMTMVRIRRSGQDVPVAATQTLVCITPTENMNVVNVATVAGGKVLATHALDASGRERPLDAKGCTGVQSANWLADERRVYLKSTAQCGGVTATSGILSITARGEWLNVQQVTAGGAENVRVMRYLDAGVPSWVPTEIASALNGRGMATRSARMAGRECRSRGARSVQDGVACRGGVLGARAWTAVRAQCQRAARPG